MAVYIRSINRHGVVRYMASVGSGNRRVRKSFRTESDAIAWDAAEQARRKGQRPCFPDARQGLTATMAEGVGKLVEVFLCCDQQSQQMIIQLAERLGRSSEPAPSRRPCINSEPMSPVLA